MGNNMRGDDIKTGGEPGSTNCRFLNIKSPDINAHGFMTDSLLMPCGENY